MPSSPLDVLIVNSTARAGGGGGVCGGGDGGSCSPHALHETGQAVRTACCT